MAHHFIILTLGFTNNNCREKEWLRTVHLEAHIWNYHKDSQSIATSYYHMPTVTYDLLNMEVDNNNNHQSYIKMTWIQLELFFWNPLSLFWETELLFPVFNCCKINCFLQTMWAIWMWPVQEHGNSPWCLLLPTKWGLAALTQVKLACACVFD